MGVRRPSRTTSGADIGPIAAVPFRGGGHHSVPWSDQQRFNNFPKQILSVNTGPLYSSNGWHCNVQRIDTMLPRERYASPGPIDRGAKLTHTQSGFRGTRLPANDRAQRAGPSTRRRTGRTPPRAVQTHAVALKHTAGFAHSRLPAGPDAASDAPSPSFNIPFFEAGR